MKCDPVSTTDSRKLLTSESIKCEDKINSSLFRNGLTVCGHFFIDIIRNMNMEKNMHMIFSNVYIITLPHYPSDKEIIYHRKYLLIVFIKNCVCFAKRISLILLVKKKTYEIQILL